MVLTQIIFSGLPENENPARPLFSRLGTTGTLDFMVVFRFKSNIYIRALKYLVSMDLTRNYGVLLPTISPSDLFFLLDQVTIAGILVLKFKIFH